LKKFTSSGLEPATFRMQILFNVEWDARDLVGRNWGMGRG
jgi:hypothetical protein